MVGGEELGGPLALEMSALILQSLGSLGPSKWRGGLREQTPFKWLLVQGSACHAFASNCTWDSSTDGLWAPGLFCPAAESECPESPTSVPGALSRGLTRKPSSLVLVEDKL